MPGDTNALMHNQRFSFEQDIRNSGNEGMSSLSACLSAKMSYASMLVGQVWTPLAAVMVPPFMNLCRFARKASARTADLLKLRRGPPKLVLLYRNLHLLVAGCREEMLATLYEYLSCCPEA